MYTDFFTFTHIDGCIIACSYGDTCGAALTGTDVTVTNANSPWEITAKNDIIPGYYNKQMCIQCTVNNALTAVHPFNNAFTIEQPKLGCDSVLVIRSDAPTAITVPYLDGGASLSKSYLDFFTETAVTDCTFTCNFGDTCGSGIALTDPNIWETTGPYTLHYNQNFKNGYATAPTICLYCIATNNKVDTHIFSIQQIALNCDPSLVAIPQPNPISNIYVSGGTGIPYTFTSFFTFTPIAGCTLTCSYGDTCGGAFTGTNVLVTNAANPWQITAKNNIIPGYFGPSGQKTICLRCNSNNALTLSPFTNTFTIEQPELDCTSLLVVRGDAPSVITVPYLDGGASLSKSYLDFFTETAVTDCTFTCNFGDTCGSGIALTDPNIWETTGPYTLHYNQNFKNGYATAPTICLYCIATNNKVDTHIFSIQQIALNCDPSLVAIPQPNPISNIYVSGGTGIPYTFTSFFTFTPIAGCTLTCSYGDTCGGAFTGTNVLVTNAANPWQISVPIDNIAGYSKQLCLQCSINNALTKSPFSNTFMFEQPE